MKKKPPALLHRSGNPLAPTVCSYAGSVETGLFAGAREGKVRATRAAMIAVSVERCAI